MTILSVQASENQLQDDRQVQSSLESSDDATLFSGVRAVIVEDEGVIQLQLKKSLHKLGMKVVGTAINGEEGVGICLNERPEIIFMDINMPGQINGLEAARRILAEYRACIIILTAYTEYEEEARKLGACGYVVKPVDAMMLRYQLRKAFVKFQARQSMSAQSLESTRLSGNQSDP